jgi:Domain of unknown function (DUF4124)
MNLLPSRIAPLAYVAVGVLMFAFPAAATLYKWTDANGRVVYSDQPPPGKTEVKTLQGPPPPANPAAAKELATKELEYKQRQLEVAEASKKAEKDNATAKELTENCMQVKGSLDQLSTDQFTLYRVNEKGQRVAMDDAARRAERDRLVKWMKEAKCPV